MIPGECGEARSEYGELGAVWNCKYGDDPSSGVATRPNEGNVGGGGRGICVGAGGRRRSDMGRRRQRGRQ
jgi:hypothetical protein